MHECVNLFHLIDVLGWLLLAYVIVRVLIGLLLLLLVGTLQGHVDIPNHLVVLKFDVILERNCQAFVLKLEHQIVVCDQLS